MAVFYRRHSVYRAGVVLMFLGLGFYMVGMFNSYWTEYTVVISTYGHQRSTPDDHGSPWTGCENVTTMKYVICQPTALQAVIVMQSIALAGFLLAGSYAVVVNCLVKDPFHKRILEITAFFSSMCALAGLAIYMVNVPKNVTTDTRLVDGQQTTLKHHLSWGFFVDLIGCFIVIVACPLITLYNHPLPQPDHIPLITYPSVTESDDYPTVQQTAHARPSGTSGEQCITTLPIHPPPYYVLFPQAAADVPTKPPPSSGSSRTELELEVVRLPAAIDVGAESSQMVDGELDQPLT